MTTVRAERPASCDRCWATVESDDRFCGRCGTLREPTPATLLPDDDPLTTPLAFPQQTAPATPSDRPGRHAAPPLQPPPAPPQGFPTAPPAGPGKVPLTKAPVLKAQTIAAPAVKAPAVKAPVTPTPTPPAGPDRSSGPEETSVAPPAWAPWTAVGGLALLGLMAVVASFGDYYGHSADTPGYLPIALLDSVLLIGFAVVAGLAVRGLLVGDSQGAGLAGSVTGAAVVSAVLSGAEQGLGAIAALGALVAAAGVVVVASTGRDHDPLGAARRVVLVVGIGSLVAGVRAGCEAGYFSTGSYGFGCIAWLAVGVALLVARSTAWGQRSGRLVVACSAPVHLLAVTSANGGEAVGCLLLGLHLAAVALLFAPAPARAAFGEDPLPGLVSIRDAVRQMIGGRSGPAGSTRTASAGRKDDSWSAMLSALPIWVYLVVGLGAVIAIAGLVTLTSHTSAADACFVTGNRSFGLVRDTPQCDAAFDGEDTGKLLMAVGVVVALAPFKLVDWVEKHFGGGRP